MALLTRSLRRSLLDSQSVWASSRISPQRAHYSTISHHLETGNVPDPLIQSGHHISAEMKAKSKSTPSVPNSKLPPPSSRPVPPANARQDIVAKHITPSIRQLLPHLHSQSPHYFSIHIHGHPYLLTAGDTVRLPFLMPSVKPGDVLRLNRVTHIGSRDYTLKAPEVIKGTRDHVKKVFYLDERLFVCRARVIGIESEPMRIMEKTKRRQRHVKHVRSKHRYTVLKISEIELRSLEEYEKLLEEERKQ